MKDYKVYLLDFDGTIVDSENSLVNVFVRAYEKLNIKVNNEQIRHLMRIPLSQGYKELNAPAEKHQEFRDDITRLLNAEETVRLTTLFDDTLSLLKYLKNNNKIIGVVTGNNRKHFYDVLDYLDIDRDYFSVFVGNEDIKIHKPNPDPLFLALKQLNYSGDMKDVCYVGDAEMDMIAAKRAGVDGIIVDRHNEFNHLDCIKIKTLKELEK